MEKTLINTVEGNRLLQLFMIKDTVSDGVYEERSAKHLKHFEDLKYHTSWDWLMPVWVKFMSLPYTGAIKSTHPFNQHFIRVQNAVAVGDIEKAFTRLVDAIQWHNGIHTPSS